MSKLINVLNLGRLDYSSCLRVQQFFVAAHLNQSGPQVKNTILLVEHEPVYTVGLRRKDYTEHELNKLRSLNAQVAYTDRGGLITFHGPGQLVAYPILNLKEFTPSLKWYVNELESTVIDMCANKFKLSAHRLCNTGYTGVWCEDKKIAAIGIHCKRYITYHGVALNCNIDLNWFEHIVPCGIQDKQVGSLSSLLGRNIGVNEVLPCLIDTFGKRLHAQTHLKSSDETRLILKEILAEI